MNRRACPILPTDNGTHVQQLARPPFEGRCCLLAVRREEGEGLGSVTWHGSLKKRGRAKTKRRHRHSSRKVIYLVVAWSVLALGAPFTRRRRRAESYEPRRTRQ